MIRTGHTICAPATTGGGAISVIRMSGSSSIGICKSVFYPRDIKVDLADQPGYTIVYGVIRAGDEIIDDVLVSVFREPHSYTGEDSVEISCHASPYVRQKILELLILNGAVAAQPGEFSMRAFMNGKMDLLQAEAVADLIASESRASHRIAIDQLRGAFSGEIRKLRADLLYFASLIELELDFGEEDVEFADRTGLSEIVNRVLAVTRGLSSSFGLGNAIKNGVPVVIAGLPNTGKSTLLNRLLSEERALVTEIPGTTRDAIEDVTVIEGIKYRFIDTAGLRETKDHVETLGIKKTHEKIQLSSIVLLMADVNDGPSPLSVLLDNIREQAEGKDIIILVNKIDAAGKDFRTRFASTVKIRSDEKLLFISALTGEGIDVLKETLVGLVLNEKLSSEDVIITSIRHYEALVHVTESLERVLTGLEEKLPEDLIAIDVRQAIHYLGEITGEITTDEILGNIFKNFCIGK